MLKIERHKYILEKLKQNHTVTVNDIVKTLNVSDMTARRDLAELEKQGKLRRVHGGARSISLNTGIELSHDEKKVLNIKEKEYIADIALRFINDDDMIFLGPGTTIEILANKINNTKATFVTNCLPVFKSLSSKNIKVYLLGGQIREITQSFFGDMTLNVLEKIKFSKSFISCNAVNKNEIMTATFSEGKIQSKALDNTRESYLLIDSNKIGQEDFFAYYKLENIHTVITNDDEFNLYKNLEKYTEVITK